MLQGLFKRAENSIDHLVAKYVGRAAVAIPLLVAAGFATAALTVELVNRYGAVTSYAVMAVLFAVIGLITMAVIGTGAPEAAAESTEAPSGTESASAEASAADSGPLFPPEMMAVLTSAAPAALPGIARGIGRNLPLIFVLALLAFIVSQFAETPGEPTDDAKADAAEPGSDNADAREAPPAAAA